MKGTSEKFYCTYTGLYGDVKVGDIILIDDGNLEMKVIEKDEKPKKSSSKLKMTTTSKTRKA
jgi:pyruvate kinase